MKKQIVYKKHKVYKTRYFSRFWHIFFDNWRLFGIVWRKKKT